MCCIGLLHWPGFAGLALRPSAHRPPAVRRRRQPTALAPSSESKERAHHRPPDVGRAVAGERLHLRGQGGSAAVDAGEGRGAVADEEGHLAGRHAHPRDRGGRAGGQQAGPLLDPVHGQGLVGGADADAPGRGPAGQPDLGEGGLVAAHLRLAPHHLDGGRLVHRNGGGEEGVSARVGFASGAVLDAGEGPDSCVESE